ncbi:hypothetical protein [Variovorax rhizosphaerae]|uniref:Uncharacterized protein n=1 Tax=Variovorax rhizosphaerae TaxID=1836200 RepID=A0ABU8WYH5_9BURK
MPTPPEGDRRGDDDRYRPRHEKRIHQRCRNADLIDGNDDCETPEGDSNPGKNVRIVKARLLGCKSIKDGREFRLIVGKILNPAAASNERPDYSALACSTSALTMGPRWAIPVPLGDLHFRREH